MMEHSQPVSRETPSNVRDITCPQTGLGLGLRKPSTARQGIAKQCPEREGQRPSVPRKQAGHTSASDQCKMNFKYVLLCSSYPHRTFVHCAAFWAIEGWQFGQNAIF
jgi:hypothetical protein